MNGPQPIVHAALPSYDMECHVWLLRLKNSENQYRGQIVSFVVYASNEANTGAIYPLAIKKEFAFCPAQKLQEFTSNKHSFTLVPDYILFFDRNEIAKFELDTKM